MSDFIQKSPARTLDIGPLLRARYRMGVRKVGIRLGASCPHRVDDQGGCVFCAEKATGEAPPVESQLQRGLSRIGECLAIAYLQDHSATLVSPSVLDHALSILTAHPRVASVTLGTRPDCLPDPIVDLLRRHADTKELLVELGLQTANNRTLELINRQHTVRCFELAVKRLHSHGIRVCAHVILGLPTPGESGQLATETVVDAIATARLLTRLNVEAVKLHNCHVLEGTVLADIHHQSRYEPPNLDGYIERLIPFLEHLPPTVEIHRLVGEAQPPSLIAPAFTAKKAQALQAIRAALEERDTWQGRSWDINVDADFRGG